MDTYRASTHDSSKKFFADLLELFARHRMAVVPTFENKVSFHDCLRVVPLDAQTLEFLLRTDFIEGKALD